LPLAFEARTIGGTERGGGMTNEGKAVRTKDGRALSYSELGERSGVAVLWFHGIPGSRLDVARAFGEKALAGAGTRLIGIDRPGFGGSDFQRRRRFEDWPADVAALADELGIEHFAVVGYSCGAPYVVACAHAMPERLTFAGIVSGVGPAEMPRFRDGLNRVDALMTRLARLAPPLARLAIKQAARQAGREPQKFDNDFEKELSPPDRELYADPELRAALRDIFLESTRNGPRGVVHDYAIWGRRWGFPFEEVEFPVRLWHGDDDDVVPLHHGEYLAGRLGDAELTVLPGAGHLHPPERWRDVFSTAVAASRAPKAPSGP
jgi:pimeloyl-ACP methyl ester carboxylesterase